MVSRPSSAERSARRRVHTVTPERVREVSDLLGLVATGWEGRLAGLKAVAEQPAEQPAERPAGPGPASP